MSKTEVKAEQSVEKLIEDTEFRYEIAPELETLVKEVLEKRDEIEKKRFRTKTDFIDAAIELYAKWWTNPLEAQKFMYDPKKKPTIEQLALMKGQGVPAENLEQFRNATKTQITIQDVDKFLEAHPEYSEQPKEKDPQREVRSSKGYLKKLRDEEYEVQKFIKKINFDIIKEKDNQKEIKYDGWPLLSSYYSRLFPAKVSIVAITNLMYQRKNEVIQLDETTLAYIYNIAEELSKELRGIEEKLERKRFEKYSTGLPKPFPLNEKMNATQALSEKRWKDRFIGKRGKGENIEKDGEDSVFFNGILSALGLARAFYDKDKKKVFLTLTAEGKEFYLQANGLLWDVPENNKMYDPEYEGTFESDERKFFIERILPGLELEMKLVIGAIKTITVLGTDTTKSHAKHLDDVFYNTVKEFVDKKEDSHTNRIKKTIIKKTDDEGKDDNAMTPIKAHRVATMGRLSEMGLVKWTLAKVSGESVYEIKDKKMAEAILK